jgi:15-cis-phytoene synthase
MTTTLDRSYAVAESITREQARNFYYGIRLLTRPKRSALCALYALARRIDDIGDGDLPRDVKLARLAELRQNLAGLDSAAAAPDPVLSAVADVARSYPVPLSAFTEIIDGVEMDVAGRHYETFDDLVSYCRCVAGAVGRLCLGVFGSSPSPDAARLADVLGIALQQTNILRDIREDLLSGRVYLPDEDLERFGVTLRLDAQGRLRDDDGALSALVRFAAQRARGWYDEGLGLVPLLDRRSAACCTAMSGIYQRLLFQIYEDPTRVFGERLSLSGVSKAGVAVRALTGRAV